MYVVNWRLFWRRDNGHINIQRVQISATLYEPAGRKRAGVRVALGFANGLVGNRRHLAQHLSIYPADH